MDIPPLHLLCRECAVGTTSSPTPNPASVRALYIFSTWKPIESLTLAGRRMEVQNGGTLTTAAIRGWMLRWGFFSSHSESRNAPEDAKFKAKAVNGCNNLLERK